MSTEGFWNVHAFSGNSTIPVRPTPIEHPESVRFMLEDLAKSGLLPADLDCYPIAPERDVAQYVIPYPQDGMYRVKRNDPKFKYKGPQNRNEVWFSPHQVYRSFRSSPVLLIIEGEKKAARAVKEWPNIPVLAIGGVWNGTPKQPDGTHRLHETIVNSVAPGQRVLLIFDSDIIGRSDLEKAAFTLQQLLQQQSCKVELYTPPSPNKGLDDYLVARQQMEQPHVALEEVGLVQIPFEQLTPTRSALVKELRLAITEDGAIVINSSNYAKLFAKFIGSDIRYDRRLGYIDKKARSVDMEGLRIRFIEYLEMAIKLKHIRLHIDYAEDAFKQTISTDVLLDEILAIQWDGVERLATWGADYIPNAIGYSQLSAEWGRLLITGMGMRLFQPGTKFDYVMFLVGPQGSYKTSFFEALGNFKCGNFYGTIDKIAVDDSAKRTLGAKVRRNVILDFSESSVLDGRQTSIEALKSFVTHTVDEFREVYTKNTTQLPRSFIFVGTSNKHHQLFDTTGSRRFAMLDIKDNVRPLEYDVKMQLLAEVRTKQHAIEATRWYEFNLDWDNVPQELVEEIEKYGFAPNVNLTEGNQILEGLNLKHIKEDPNISDLKTMLEDPEDHFPTHHMHPGKYMTTIAHLMVILEMSKRDVTIMIRRLQDDPHFPWTLDPGSTANLKSFEYPPSISQNIFISMTNGSGIIKPYWIGRK